jgi:hypothetical protein
MTRIGIRILQLIVQLPIETRKSNTTELSSSGKHAVPQAQPQAQVHNADFGAREKPLSVTVRTKVMQLLHKLERLRVCADLDSALVAWLPDPLQALRQQAASAMHRRRGADAPLWIHRRKLSSQGKLIAAPRVRRDHPQAMKNR